MTSPELQRDPNQYALSLTEVPADQYALFDVSGNPKPEMADPGAVFHPEDAPGLRPMTEKSMGKVALPAGARVGLQRRLVSQLPENKLTLTKREVEVLSPEAQRMYAARLQHETPTNGHAPKRSAPPKPKKEDLPQVVPEAVRATNAPTLIPVTSLNSEARGPKAESVTSPADTKATDNLPTMPPAMRQPIPKESLQDYERETWEALAASAVAAANRGESDKAAAFDKELIGRMKAHGATRADYERILINAGYQPTPSVEQPTIPSFSPLNESMRTPVVPVPAQRNHPQPTRVHNTETWRVSGTLNGPTIPSTRWHKSGDLNDGQPNNYQSHNHQPLPQLSSVDKELRERALRGNRALLEALSRVQDMEPKDKYAWLNYASEGARMLEGAGRKRSAEAIWELFDQFYKELTPAQRMAYRKKHSTFNYEVAPKPSGREEQRRQRDENINMGIDANGDGEIAELAATRVSDKERDDRELGLPTKTVKELRADLRNTPFRQRAERRAIKNDIKKAKAYEKHEGYERRLDNLGVVPLSRKQQEEIDNTLRIVRGQYRDQEGNVQLGWSLYHDPAVSEDIKREAASLDTQLSRNTDAWGVRDLFAPYRGGQTGGPVTRLQMLYKQALRQRQQYNQNMQQSRRAGTAQIMPPTNNGTPTGPTRR